MFYTYILQGSNDKYYAGYTGNIDQRLTEHQNKTNTKYTASMGEITLVGYFQYPTKQAAIIQERKMKRSRHISRYIDYIGFIKIRN